MLRNQMLNLITILWCCVLLKTVASFDPFYDDDDDDVMIIGGRSLNSSDIKRMATVPNISKIYVFVTDTFYADEDLKLSGIMELQIFAYTWNITQPSVTFDLSGSDGTNLKPASVGSGGKTGNLGMNGANFFGLANEVVNGGRLTIKTNGGNGGAGQDGGVSDDIYVLLSVEEDSGESGWFSKGDVHSFYKKYFDDKGYDSEIIDNEDETTPNAVFWQDKQASFSIRLHPKKCCGTTGIGGAGGLGGYSGKFDFRLVVESSESTPTFVGHDGSVGTSGKDGKICENLALDVRIDAELKEVAFVYLPLHHSFSSHFTALDHTNSSKCSPVYERSIATSAPSKTTEPSEIEIALSIIRYKGFLLKCMENKSLAASAQKSYKAIDESWEIDDTFSLKNLAVEACELEKKFVELKESIDLTPSYQQLLHRIDSRQRYFTDRDGYHELHQLKYIVQRKLNDIAKEYSLIIKLELFTETVVSTIDRREKQFPVVTGIRDLEYQNILNQLRFLVNRNFILQEYSNTISGFQFSYFPYAVGYLENYRLPASATSYRRSNAIIEATIKNLNTVAQSIKEIKSNYGEIMVRKPSIDNTDPESALYIWKNSEIREEIANLFEGKKVTLLTDIKKSPRQLNLFKFNTVELVFRSPQQYINSRLDDTLRAFNVNFNHTGLSAFRCNDHFYQLTSHSVFISFSFEKARSQDPVFRNLVYDKFKDNEPILSPYTLWEIHLDLLTRRQSFGELAQFVQQNIDIELHGTGTYIQENAPICDNENLKNFYTRIEN